MLRTNKKGFRLVGPALVWVIIAVASLITVFSVAVPLYFRFTESSSVNACHVSVAFRTVAAQKAGGAGELVTPLACETNHEGEIAGGREELKARLARMMSKCWYMFNEGRQDDLFDDKVDVLLDVAGFSDNKNKCFLCYTLETPKKIDGGEIQPKEMFDYMVSTNHYEKKGLTYLNYIQSFGGPGGLAILDKIEPQHAYGIVYLSKSKSESSWTWADSTAAGALAAGGLACLTGIGCIPVLIGAAVPGGAYLAAHGVNEVIELKQKFYQEERALSTVVVDNLKAIETSDCLVQDIAGI